jgi:flavin reductase (DIM6/NTAB) family NADH-FMN oxidoreductase RutF
MIDSIALATNPPVPDRFRAMMRSFPTGVAVVTATDVAGKPWGMTCSSLCSVALEPPTLLVCLRMDSPTLAAILDRSMFTVNLLGEESQVTAELFASGRSDRFDLVKWHMEAAAGGPHLPEDAHAVADCRVTRQVPVGDHVVVFGETFHVTWREDRSPLIHGLSRYRSWPTG